MVLLCKQPECVRLTFRPWSSTCKSAIFLWTVVSSLKTLIKSSPFSPVVGDELWSPSWKEKEWCATICQTNIENWTKNRKVLAMHPSTGYKLLKTTEASVRFIRLERPTEFYDFNKFKLLECLLTFCKAIWYLGWGSGHGETKISSNW